MTKTRYQVGDVDAREVQKTNTCQRCRQNIKTAAEGPAFCTDCAHWYHCGANLWAYENEPRVIHPGDALEVTTSHERSK